MRSRVAPLICLAWLPSLLLAQTGAGQPKPVPATFDAATQKSALLYSEKTLNRLGKAWDAKFLASQGTDRYLKETKGKLEGFMKFVDDRLGKHTGHSPFVMLAKDQNVWTSAKVKFEKATGEVQFRLKPMKQTWQIDEVVVKSKGFFK